ncbi:MAG: hypothetical protein ABEJ40_06335 [Haloarculaceae archaeon]
MDVDELQSVQSRERQTDSLQQLRESFYRDVADYVQQLREERDRAAERADDPWNSPEVGRLNDDIDTAEQTVEAIYERRVGKIVKMASLAAADMPTDDEGLTAEERDLFETLVAAIENNREHVFAVLDGESPVQPGTAGSGTPDSDADGVADAPARDANGERPTPPDDGGRGDSTPPDGHHTGSATPPTGEDAADPESRSDEHDPARPVDAADLMAGDGQAERDASAGPGDPEPGSGRGESGTGGQGSVDAGDGNRAPDFAGQRDPGSGSPTGGPGADSTTGEAPVERSDGGVATGAQATDGSASADSEPASRSGSGSASAAAVERPSVETAGEVADVPTPESGNGAHAERPAEPAGGTRSETDAPAAEVDGGSAGELADSGTRADVRTEAGDADVRAEAGDADVERTTLRITEDVGEIYGVDQRAYDLSAEDVVTLPASNAGPLVDRDAAERLE